MSRPVAALLILLVALTSIGLGTARGTVLHGNEVVLCTGNGIVVTRLSGDSPDSRVHLCPDMALSMMTALVDHFASSSMRPSLPQPLPPRAVLARVAASDRHVRVRGPPLSV